MSKTIYYTTHSTFSSSVIDQAWYNSFDRVLSVQFTSGGAVSYANVPENIFKGLVHSASAGRYYNLNIKGQYLGDSIGSPSIYDVRFVLHPAIAAPVLPTVVHANDTVKPRPFTNSSVTGDSFIELLKKFLEDYEVKVSLVPREKTGPA